ncbi:DUF433 domain-containing protein [Saccharothrix longispora]|uniref:DUF433 domain-containing protein n=1 Tax=Saccharothrix longispora TaxID=33920 RepID=UPI0028FD5593|nr:DUF433 domain-containing protein [Saccharothrix longispora]MDU0291428.1 DUF433 domain-containing protein [Saccharothrix longispora]
MFPAELASVLSGASMGQLAHWRKTGLLVPEGGGNPVRYSFQDVVALRMVMKLRTDLSLQKVRKAFANLPVFNFTAHPAEYRFGTDHRTIAVLDDQQWMDLVRKPGQYDMFTLADVFQPFVTQSGREVVDFRRPRRRITVDGGRLGGWPTIAGTRVGFDTIAALVEDGSVEPEEVRHFYPAVSVEAVADAVSFAEVVTATRSGTA